MKAPQLAALLGSAVALGSLALSIPQAQATCFGGSPLVGNNCPFFNDNPQNNGLYYNFLDANLNTPGHSYFKLGLSSTLGKPISIFGAELRYSGALGAGANIPANTWIPLGDITTPGQGTGGYNTAYIWSSYPVIGNPPNPTTKNAFYVGNAPIGSGNIEIRGRIQDSTDPGVTKLTTGDRIRFTVYYGSKDEMQSGTPGDPSTGVDVFLGGDILNRNSVYASVPAPLPLVGAGVAFGYSRRLRRRLKAAKA